MATIADLVVKIRGEIRDFVKSTDKVQHTFGTLRKHAGKLGLAIGAAFAANKIQAFIGAQLAAADALGKTSSKLGIQVEELQKLRFAAEQTGVSAGTLDTALQRMVRRVSEAAQGSGSAVKALQEMGLSAQELARLSPDQQFKRIADAMRGTASEGDRVRLAMALFDTEGVALVNTLKGGAGTINLFGKELAATGGIMGGELVAAAEKANDAWNKLGFVFQRFVNKILPLVSEALEKVATLLEQTADLAAGGLQGLFEGNLRREALDKTRENNERLAPFAQRAREERARQAGIAERERARLRQLDLAAEEENRRIRANQFRSRPAAAPDNRELVSPFVVGRRNVEARNARRDDFLREMAGRIRSTFGQANQDLAAGTRGSLAAFQQIAAARRSESLSEQQVAILEQIRQNTDPANQDGSLIVEGLN